MHQLIYLRLNAFSRTWTWYFITITKMTAENYTKNLYKLVLHFLYFSNTHPQTCSTVEPKMHRFFNKSVIIFQKAFGYVEWMIRIVAFICFSIIWPIYNKTSSLQVANVAVQFILRLLQSSLVCLLTTCLWNIPLS